MEKNLYKEYFKTLKYYLTVLNIDKDKGLIGCSEEEIDSIKSKKDNFPLAYEEYLRSIGKKFLFEFMDAEDMAFEDLDYINEFANDVFENNSLRLENEFLVLSERRNDYISIIFTKEENPAVWIMSEYWDESKGENLSIRTKSFTDLMNEFFRQTLQNHTSSFHFVSSKIKDTEKYIENKYISWVKGLNEIKQKIDDDKIENNLVNQLNQYFLDYYIPNISAFTKILSDSKSKQNNKREEKDIAEENKRQVKEYIPEKKQTLLEKFFNLFK
ncbi:hypothetical protein [Chryseobacterium chendengshani]|uniref:hypothetical protein n=1 Tax=unclassified Chryseobacterium TaxID=2593645 RepID=UPI001C641313|nr:MULTISPECIES: hypothetical protein [unclassified Chryseobacterium]MBW7674947.1 hypothetical protein [Chryseobacterium sp. LJ756]MBW8523440.1 hypothetical protein [Chryseobacterium sp. LJ668]QYK15727.1 hypothetical protein K0U91_11725 [Chryseobacterium sp. LJ668]